MYTFKQTAIFRIFTLFKPDVTECSLLFILSWPTKYETIQQSNKDTGFMKKGRLTNTLGEKFLSYAVYFSAYSNNRKSKVLRQ